MNYFKEINLKDNCTKLIYLSLIFAILNGCLRLTSSGATSIFRLFSPFLLFFLLYNNKKLYEKDILILVIAFIYSTVTSILFYQHISFDMWIFAGYLVVTFFFMKYLYFFSVDFYKEFFSFLNFITIISIILGWLQFFVRIPYPYLKMPYPPGVNIFMSNENEIAAAWGCMFIVYLYELIFEKRKKYFLIIVNLVLLIYINEAKLTIMGMVVSIMIYFIFWIITKIKTNLSVETMLFLFLIAMSILIILLIVWNPVLRFRDYKISINDLFFNKVKEIIMLQPTLGSGGSLVDRTNAIIFGLIELKRSFFLGIGWGNSIIMLKNPQYSLLTAESMHNIIMQFLVEYGIFAIIVYSYIIKRLLKEIKEIRLYNLVILKISFVIAFIFISSQSSIGVLSNYYMWMIVFYVFLLRPKDVNGKSNKLCNTSMG